MKEIRGAKIKISLELLLDLIGLERGSIELESAMVDPDSPNVFILILRGNDERLPIIKEGEFWPVADVICHQSFLKPGIEAHLEVKEESQFDSKVEEQ